MTINKILIANRGEIACRIIRTARSLGISSVAVYSDADKNALHTTMADHAIHIGASPAIESYLNIEKIIQVALNTDSDAIHPGYGFLSENANFAQACETAGIVFIGPSAHAITVMGDKALAKKAMISEGIPCVPGYLGEKQDDQSLIQSAKEIGVPLLIKAAAGGGGRGMRRVDRLDQIPEAIKLARSESYNAFGSEELILEKVIASARHVEIQIFADMYDNIIHLGERDCSLQRRYQKVIEEAPCPAMNPDLRIAMGNAAISAARAVNYVGAGTVEFLLGNNDQFYFLEMNTRLQVEHPVTEEITGLDLVALQISVASGEPLKLSQDDIQLKGHAIEARLYAENPSNEFIPSSGKINLWRSPQSSHVRVDTGIETGNEISPFYDAMVAKIIAKGSNRSETLQRLLSSLKNSALCGVTSNREFLIDLLNQSEFKSGLATTSFISDTYSEDSYKPQPLSIEQIATASLIDYLLRHSKCKDHTIAVNEELLGWSSTHDLGSFLDFQIGEKNYATEIRPLELLSRFEVSVNSETTKIELLTFSDEEIEVRIADHSYKVYYADTPSKLYVSADTLAFELTKCDTLNTSNIQSAISGSVKAPMHGKLVEVCVKSGDFVTRGDRVAVLEAMKMQHELIAEISGVVTDIFAEKDTQIALNDLILEIQPEKETEL